MDNNIKLPKITECHNCRAETNCDYTRPTNSYSEKNWYCEICQEILKYGITNESKAILRGQAFMSNLILNEIKKINK